MARQYTFGAANQTVLGATTLAFIHAGTTCALRLLRMWVSQSANATSAMQRIQVETQVTVFPTLVSATPQKLWEGDPISQIIGGTAGAAGTCGVNASAEGAGGKTVKFEDAFNVLNGWLWVPTPNEVIVCSPGSGSGYGLFFPSVPATLTGWTFGMTFEEVG